MEKESKKRLIKYVVLIPIAIVFGYFIFITARNEISNIYYKKGLEKADKEAIADFNTAIKVNPHNIAAYIEKAKRLGKTMEALTILNAAIEICPSINDTTYIGSKNYRYNGYDYSFNSLYSMRARLYISLNK